jgi:two-component system, NtrC family, sensor kinase
MEHELNILVGKGQGQSFKLEPGKEYFVGRHSIDDIKIDDQNISRNHFKVQVKGDRYFITDLDSKNGTFADGRDLSPNIETEVKEGAPIVVGMTILGLGEMSKLCLKPFLDSVGFSSEVNEYGNPVKPERVMAFKKNMELIYDMTDFLSESKDINEIFHKLLNSIFDLFKRIDRGAIITIDNQTGALTNITYRSRKPVDDPKNIYNKELVEKALMLNEPVMVKDTSETEDMDEKITESLRIMKIQSAMCVPINSVYSIRGIIYIDSVTRAKGFRKNDLALLKDISGRAALAIDSLSLQDGCHLEDYRSLLKYINSHNNKHKSIRDDL